MSNRNTKEKPLNLFQSAITTSIEFTLKATTINTIIIIFLTISLTHISCIHILKNTYITLISYWPLNLEIYRNLWIAETQFNFFCRLFATLFFYFCHAWHKIWQLFSHRSWFWIKLWDRIVIDSGFCAA